LVEGHGCGIALAEFDVGKQGGPNPELRSGHGRRGNIRPDDQPARSDDLSKHHRDVARAAADVERAGPLGNSRRPEKPAGDGIDDAR
jgi:hypothetical protein